MGPNTNFWKKPMPERDQRVLQGYEITSAGSLLATLLCGMALILKPSLVDHAVRLFLVIMALSGGLAAYLLARHRYDDPRFRSGTFLTWTALTIFTLAFLWVQYGMG